MGKSHTGTGDVGIVLAHYGVKGMKWGQRRTEAQLARTKARSADAKEVDKLVEKAATKGRGSLANKDLQAVIKRRELEQKFATLNPSKIQQGLNVLKALNGNGNLLINANETRKRGVKSFGSGGSSSAPSGAGGMRGTPGGRRVYNGPFVDSN